MPNSKIIFNWILHIITYLVFIIFLFALYVDEEIGGVTGMKLFVKSDDFKTLNLGFALDEGTGFYFCIMTCTANNMAT